MIYISVDSILQKVDSLRGLENSREKGSAGEEAVIEVVKNYATNFTNAKVYHSVNYDLLNGLPGNYKLENNNLLASKGTYGEIDVLMVTDYRVYVIEVKTYNAFVLIDDYWTYKGSSQSNLSEMDWCNLCQVEKSARHLYEHIYSLLPDGDPNYIVPVLVYTQGKVKVETNQYPVCILDELNFTLSEKGPLNYKLDFKEITAYIETKLKGDIVV